MFPGITFKHIRLLARAFTDRSIGFTELTLGSNEHLKFLGDAILKLIVTDRVYHTFPGHNEEHLFVSIPAYPKIYSELIKIR